MTGLDKSVINIVGQDGAISMLSRYLSSGSIPSALLFVGERGVGKMKAAIEFARAINCENIKEKGMAGSFTDSRCDCRSCSLIRNGNHPSVIVVDEKYQETLSLKKESSNSDTTGIDTVRSIQRALSLKLSRGRKTVVIVDSAQNLTREAADAFLKTLEEPSSEAVLILLTTSARTMPRTINSRCQKVFFRRLKADEIIKVISELRPEIKEFSKEVVKIFSATGSVGRSLEIMDDLEHYKQLENKFRNMDLGMGDFKKDSEAASFIEYLAASTRESFHSNPDDKIYLREAFLDALRLLSSGVNRQMVLSRLHSRLYSDKN